MNFMLYFIYMVFAEMWTTFRKRKIQNDNVCLRRESNQRPLTFQRAPLTTRLSTVRLLLKLLQYFFTRRYYKKYVLVSKGYIENKSLRPLITYSFMIDTKYQLNTKWFIKKNKLIMSYMSMTIYNIYSFFIYHFL